MDYLKRNFNTIAGWASIIALITAVPLGYLFLRLGRHTQEPIFYVDEQSSVTLLDQTSAVRPPISVLDQDGTVVAGDINLRKFYFWNNGQKPIDFSKDVIASAVTKKQQIVIYVQGDSEARILDSSCPVKTNNQYTGFELKQISPTSLLFSFNVIRYLEGVSCQIIFEGSDMATLSIEGALLEVSGDLDRESSLLRLRERIWIQEFSRWIWPVIAILPGLVILLFFLSSQTNRAKMLCLDLRGLKRAALFVYILMVWTGILLEAIDDPSASPRNPIIPEDLQRSGTAFGRIYP